MTFKAFTLGTASAACAVAVCALAAGMAGAQTAAPAAASGASASATARPRPHMAPPHAPTFEELDTNHDGVVSKAEFDAWRAAHPMPGHLGQGGAGPGGKDGAEDGHGRMHGEWGGGFEMRREMMWMHMHEMAMWRHHRGDSGKRFDFDKADTDHDGKISWAEFQAAATARLKERFDKLDKNHDGFISKDELPGHGDHGGGDHGWGGHHGHDGKDGKPASGAAASAPAQ